ncbi:hypothetical protein SDC9_162335 [bioreactor metagenome]|uniref:Uncharacterized protein n=1 Tax=bioreactor metagenome TaxID=1076179 RepID=A0A645FMV7_9ZZZZ
MADFTPGFLEHLLFGVPEHRKVTAVDVLDFPCRKVCYGHSDGCLLEHCLEEALTLFQGTDSLDTMSLAEEQQTQEVGTQRIENQNGKGHRGDDLHPNRCGHEQHAQEHDDVRHHSDQVELNTQTLLLLQDCLIPPIMPQDAY